MTRVLASWVDFAREAPDLFLSTYRSAARVCEIINDEERAAGEEPTDREAIATALMEPLEASGAIEKAKGAGRAP